MSQRRSSVSMKTMKTSYADSRRSSPVSTLSSSKLEPLENTANTPRLTRESSAKGLDLLPDTSDESGLEDSDKENIAVVDHPAESNSNLRPANLVETHPSAITKIPTPSTSPQSSPPPEYLAHLRASARVSWANQDTAWPAPPTEGYETTSVASSADETMAGTSTNNGSMATGRFGHLTNAMLDGLNNVPSSSADATL